MAYPFKKYNYKVEIDGITEASFSEVSGFDASIDVIEYRTGDEGVNWSRKNERSDQIRQCNAEMGHDQFLKLL